MAKYAYEDNPQLSPHFSAREFRCKCSSPHTFQVSEQLISMLEQLYAALDCGKIIVSSGYRCAAHDKAVGGNGAGQHTKGTAADVVCYDKSGSVISAKTVCCKAQDLGFGGIAISPVLILRCIWMYAPAADIMVMKPRAQTQ